MSESGQWQKSDAGLRTPPQDVEAEQSVLGGMLLSKDAIADVVETLKPEDFYKPAHETIYSAILDLYSKGEPADAVTASAALQKSGDLARVGGAPYLHTLIASVPTAANAGFYARIVAETALLRKLVEAGTRIVQMGFDAEGDAEEIVNTAQAEIFQVTERRTTEDYEQLSVVVDRVVDNIEKLSDQADGPAGIPTGFAEFDYLTNGLHPGQMIVIAARPGMGKSTLALDFVRSAAIQSNRATVFFSLEMSADELAMRLLSAETGIPLQSLRRGELSSPDWTTVASTMGRIHEAPLFLDDSPNMALTEIRAKCRRLKQQHNLQMVVVDYLQLMSSGKRVESRQQEVSEFSRSLKLLAKELEVPVIALSQLNRSSEQRTDKRPMISDLRESGSIEQDADMVLLIHREDMYDKEHPRAGEADIIVAKHRAGPTGDIPVAFQGAKSRFVDMPR
ncbi:replicative DNA helicase [Brevibacterium album]|uniref:replicative DNA helicase n=1 Tax=Brevibacterium album TaxID=417948 RepID=UPI00042246EA|nr:replicative DNA helicase [Brevibacterium album]